MNGRWLTGLIISGGVAASLGLAAPDAAETATRAARGAGSMSFGHEEEGRGLLRFALTEGEVITGSLTFAAEHHHEMFPDIVVRLGHIDEATFTANSVKFKGPGFLHDDQVTVKVRAWDHGKRKADRFTIVCLDRHKRVVFEADGSLFRGDIVVGAK